MVRQRTLGVPLGRRNQVREDSIIDLTTTLENSERGTEIVTGRIQKRSVTKALIKLVRS